ncbi:DENN domain-containing protein 5B isoform X3 [Chironomus tepperi]|uniref:DENN domain-containing protein 5B isoform X3 n=1 Tax=Chironomus tepperi TaxID=113505 RepID=UPI00391F71FF
MMDAKFKKGSSALKSLSEKHHLLPRFADYFAICGLDVDLGLEAELYTDGVTTSPPLDRSYKGKSLINYPANVSWNPFDSYGICMLSLPQGLKFRTQKHDLTPRFHSFISTRDDGKRCYGFSLIFYEEVKNENICTAMQTLQSMYITELSSSQGSLRRSDPVSRSLPRHFRLAEDDKSSNSAASFYDIQKDTLFVTKSITLVCQFAYSHIAEIFLTNLYKCLPRTPGARLSLESYVYNILYDVKVPDFGKSIRIYLPPEQPNLTPINIIIQRPKTSELPLLDFPLRLLFEFLGVKYVIDLFTSVLLENQVLLISEDFQKLTIVAECITALLFPFEWPHVYAPILPTALHHFLDAPVPFVMGLHDENVDANSQKVGLCYVDIDNRNLQIHEDLPSFPHQQDFIDEIYEVLAKYNLVDDKSYDTVDKNESDTILNPKSLLMNNNFYFQPSGSDKYSNVQYQRLSTSTSPATTLTLTKSRRKKHSLHDFIEFDNLGSNSRNYNEHNQGSSRSSSTTRKTENILRSNEQYYNDLHFNVEIREIFLNRFCQIFLDYEQFVILPNQNKTEWLKNRESLHNFDKASFLSDQPAHYRSFFSQFLESQMFATLIDNKIMTSFDEKTNSSIDAKTSKNNDMDVNKNLQLFDNRIKILKKHFGSAEEINVRSKNLENIPHMNSSKMLLDKRLKNFDLEVSPPVELLRNSPAYYRSFPLLEASVLNQASSERPNSLRRVKKKLDLDERKLHEKKNSSTKFYLREIDIDKNLSGSAESLSISSSVGGTISSSIADDKNSKVEEFTASFVAQTNWSFVEKLLKECKTKTKRMLMEKIDMEVGSGSADVEENSLITSLCDLLEKIWSHGLIQPHSKSAHTKNHYHNNNQIKSPFWSHLLRYFEKMEKMNALENGENMKGSRKLESGAQLLTTPDLSSLKVEPQDMSSSFIATSSTPSPTASLQRRAQQQKSRRSKSCEKRTLLSNDNMELVLPKLPDALEYDIRNILSMHEIKTDIGYARAFVRLTLEKKVLSRHLKTLLSDVSILRSMYKRTAFLTYEEEKEQFLYHLLTLNAVDYFCFTSVYGMTIIPYRILIVPVSGTGTLTRKSTLPKLWLTIFGSIGETEKIALNKIELLMENKNLGVLRTMRIGIDGTQSTSTLSTSAKFHLDCIWIRNEVTGHAYKFPCNRWLGRGIDDGSMERLLIAQLIRPTADPMDDQFSTTLMEKPPLNIVNKLPSSSPSSMTESFTNTSVCNDEKEKKDPNEIQNNLSDSVNKIVKWFYRHQRRLMNNVDCSHDMSVLTNLLCGDGGFVESLMASFMLGFRSQRLFGRNFCLWDFFVRCKDEFEQNLTADTIASMQGINEQNHADERLIEVWNGYCQLVDEISKNSTIGSDEKFQLFICLCLREHLLHRMLPALSTSRTASEMYDDSSFLRHQSLNRFLYQILQSLGDFPFDLDNSITSSLASNC